MWPLKPSSSWSHSLFLVRDGELHATLPSGPILRYSSTWASSDTSFLHSQAQSFVISLSLADSGQHPGQSKTSFYSVSFCNRFEAPAAETRALSFLRCWSPQADLLRASGSSVSEVI